MKIDLTGLRRASTRGLVSAIIFVVCAASLPAYLTFQHFQDRQILADRGVQAEVRVTAIHWSRRGTDTMNVETVDPPHFSTTLGLRPSDTVGDRIDVVFDPRAPGRIITADQPLVGVGEILFVAIDLLCVVALVGLVLPVGELVRRARARRRGDLEPIGPPLVEDRSARPRRPFLAGMETPQIVLVLVVGPLAAAAIAALFAADAVRTAEELHSSSVATRAIVYESTWTDGANGWLDVRFTLPNGTEATSYLSAQGQVHFVGDSVDIIYARDTPGNALLAEQGASSAELRIPVGSAVLLVATALIAVAVAAVVQVRRILAARPRVIE